MQRKYIHSFADFFTHTKLHQKRVKLLGTWLYDKYTAHFDTVPRNLLDGFLDLHDQAKFLPIQQVGTPPTTYLEKLYSYYGIDQNTALPMFPLGVIKEMNALELRVGVGFVDMHLYADASSHAVVLEKLKLIEHIADLVDRGKCPVSKEEFGYELLPASSYLLDPFHVELASELEQNYTTIVKPWTYEVWTG